MVDIMQVGITKKALFYFFIIDLTISYYLSHPKIKKALYQTRLLKFLFKSWNLEAPVIEQVDCFF